MTFTPRCRYWVTSWSVNVGNTVVSAVPCSIRTGVRGLRLYGLLLAAAARAVVSSAFDRRIWLSGTPPIESG